MAREIIKFDLKLEHYIHKTLQKYDYYYKGGYALIVFVFLFCLSDGFSIIDVIFVAILGGLWFKFGKSQIEKLRIKDLETTRKSFYGYFNVNREYFAINTIDKENGVMFIPKEDLKSITLTVDDELNEYHIHFLCKSINIEEIGRKFSMNIEHTTAQGTRTMVLTEKGFTDFLAFYKVYLLKRNVLMYYKDEVFTETIFYDKSGY